MGESVSIWYHAKELHHAVASGCQGLDDLMDIQSTTRSRTRLFRLAIKRLRYATCTYPRTLVHTSIHHTPALVAFAVNLENYAARIIAAMAAASSCGFHHLGTDRLSSSD